MGVVKKLEHKFKALFFYAFKFYLRKGDSNFKAIDPERIYKVLFLRPEKIGDMVISFPVFDILKEKYPNIKISLLASPRNIDVIKDDPRFDKIYIFNKDLSDLSVLKKIRKEKYDVIVDMIFFDSVTALFLSHLYAMGKPCIGVGKNKYKEYYDYNFDYRLGNTGHIIENTLKILGAFGIETDGVIKFSAPYIPEKIKHNVKRSFEKLSEDRIGSFIGYNLSAGETSRLWPIEKSISFLRKLLAHDTNPNIILMTIPSERDRAIRVKTELQSDKIIISPDNLSLIEASSLISHFDLLITPDTSLVHIARSFNVPVVGLYCQYMKNFLLWKPYNQEYGSVVSNSNDDIFDITVDQVYSAFEDVLVKNGISQIE